MGSHWNAWVVGGLVFMGSAVVGCSQKAAEPESTGEAAVISAEADLSPAEGFDVEGIISFTQGPDGVRVVAELSGLTPGEHGFHIHENGDCTAPDASSAGGHFNPAGMPHAGPEAAERHIGDLGNVTADADGFAYYDRVDPHLSLEGPYSIVGKAVVVHSGRDDLTSQPAGNAGARIACGVIQLE